MNNEKNNSTNASFDIEEFKKRAPKMSAVELSEAVSHRHKINVTKAKSELHERIKVRKAEALKAPRATRRAANKTLKDIEKPTKWSDRKSSDNMIKQWTANRDARVASEQIKSYEDQPTQEDFAILGNLVKHEVSWHQLGGVALEAAQARVEELKDSDPVVGSIDRIEAQLALGDARLAFANNVRAGLAEDTTETATAEPAPATTESSAESEVAPAPAIVIETETIGSKEGPIPFIARAIKKQLEAEKETPESIQAHHKRMGANVYARFDREFAPNKQSAEAALADLDNSIEKGSAAKSAASALDGAFEKAAGSAAEDMDRYDIDIQAYRDKVAKNRERAKNRTENRQSWKDALKAKFGALREKASDSNTYRKVSAYNPARIGNLVSSWGDKHQDDTFEHQDIIEYSDGESVLNFQQEGDKVVLGRDSKHSYAKHFDLDDMAIIRTESGKEYALVKGYLVENVTGNTGKVRKLPEDTIRLVIGKRGNLPQIGKIDRIQTVQLRYKAGVKGDITSTGPTPFKKYMDIVEEVAARS